MHLTITYTIIHLFIISTYSIPVAKIINATYSAGSAFSNTNLTTSTECVCACVRHPHCLSISTKKISNNIYYCQLFATYPIRSSQLSSSMISNVTIYSDRTLNSVYINNGSSLSNPTNLFSSNTNPWIPIFKLFSGNNQSFLWLNSSNLTTLTTIPNITINGTTSHWFSILVSQWNQGLYKLNQIGLAFIVNGTVVFDFLVFNASQSDISSWYSITTIISSQYWEISHYRTQSIAQTQVIPVYTDAYCTRSFNCNFKYSTGCSSDFDGFFFVYGGDYNDLCIAAVRNMSTVPVPSIYYSPTSTYTNGNLDLFGIASGLMGFVR